MPLRGMQDDTMNAGSVMDFDPWNYLFLTDFTYHDLNGIFPLL